MPQKKDYGPDVTDALIQMVTETRWRNSFYASSILRKYAEERDRSRDKQEMEGDFGEVEQQRKYKRLMQFRNYRLRTITILSAFDICRRKCT
jgi:hypothetical protein